MNLGKRVNYTPTAEDKVKFASLGAIGVPLEQLPSFLALHTADERNAFANQFQGIPVDSSEQSIAGMGLCHDAASSAKMPAANPVVALKADGNTNYLKVNAVIRTFQHEPIEIHKFRMITDLEESRL